MQKVSGICTKEKTKRQLAIGMRKREDIMNLKELTKQAIEEARKEENGVVTKEIVKEAVQTTEINKTTEVLKHLKEHGSITSLEAINLYGATRLSAIIFNLKKKGYDIMTAKGSCIDKYGHKCSFAKYILESEN